MPDTREDLSQASEESPELPQQPPEGAVFESGTGQPLAVVEGAADHEEQLLRRALVRDDPEVVIRLCWNLFHQDLFLHILGWGIPQDQAEDILQEVFALLHREYELVKGPRLKGWLRTMADYECKRHVQGRARLQRYLEGVGREADLHGGGSTGAPDVLVDQRRGVRVALAFLEELSPFELAVAESVLFEHLPTEELLRSIYQRFGCVLDRRQLARHRHGLRRRMAAHLCSWRTERGKGESR